MKRKVLQRREYQSLVHILSHLPEVLEDISNPLPSGSARSGVPLTSREIKISLFPQRLRLFFTLFLFKICFKTFHYRFMITEQGQQGAGGGVRQFLFVEIKQLKAIFFQLYVFVGAVWGCPPHSGRVPQISSKVSPYIAWFVFLLHMSLRSNTGSGQGSQGQSDSHHQRVKGEGKPVSEAGLIYSNKSCSQICVCNSTETTGVVYLSPFSPLNTKKHNF